jgi:hypothetical protein
MVYPIKMTKVFVLSSEVAQLTKICPREDELVKRASGLVVSSGMVNDADLGPVISRQVCFGPPHNLCYLYYATCGYTMSITL